MKGRSSFTKQKNGRFSGENRIKVVRTNDLQLTIHPIPHTRYTIGYLPKAPMAGQANAD